MQGRTTGAAGGGDGGEVIWGPFVGVTAAVTPKSSYSSKINIAGTPGYVWV